ncbi:MAG: MarR family transcriptional regulator [Nautiliaceae bacterium]|jgi:DNA-binding MarR family transcriptional regulator
MDFNEETSIGYALTTTLNLLRKHFNKKIKKFNLSSEQYGVLKLIDEIGSLTPTQLASLLNRDKATITRIIKSLEAKEFLEKEYINSRSFVLHLTKSGKEKLVLADKIAKEYHKKIVDEVGEEHLMNLLNTLSRIRNIFEGDK